jgi:hypothetical protein
MPHPANRLILDEMVGKGWFRNPQTEAFKSDNWWHVEDAQGRTALLYVVRFAATSQQGEPTRIPSMPALPEIAELHKEKGGTAGRFIALAEVSDSGATPDIVSVRVWRLSAQHLSGPQRVSVEELGTPIFGC